MAKKPPRLVQTGTADLPVLEASGLTTRTVDGVVRVLVVGDRTADVAAASLASEHVPDAWTTLDLSRFEEWPHPRGDSQFEAITADGGQIVAVMREDPPVVLIGDTDTMSARAHISLTAPPGSPLHGDFDDSSSRGEGLVLLRAGRLLVAKEKDPQALVEFSPPGVAARGLSREDFLDPDESWSAPEGAVDYLATAMWRLVGSAAAALADISSLCVAPDRSLWLLSDKSESVGRLAMSTALLPGGPEIAELDEVWRLPKKVTKPEGMVFLDERRLLVALDTRSKKDNAIVVEPPDDRRLW